MEIDDDAKEIVREIGTAINESVENSTKVAEAIERAVTAKRPRTRYRVTPVARLFITLRRLLPDRGWDALVGRSYPRP